MQRGYTHVFVEHLREVADKLDEIYMPEGWEDRLGLPIPGRRARKA